MVGSVVARDVIDRAGAFAPAAERFAHERFGSRASLATPAERLRALYAALDSFLREEPLDAVSDHRFVEGAGALLGTILIDHLPNARHCNQGEKHRVRLGDYGYFDPFAVIEATLDSDDPRALLASAVSEAEAESRGDGPLSRVVQRLSERLAVVRPTLRIAAQFDAALSLEDASTGERMELDLARAVSSTRGEPASAVEPVVAKLLSVLPGATEGELAFDEVRTGLVPRLCRADAVRELSSSAQTTLWSAPVAGDLVLSLQHEIEGRARYVREREVRAWGLADGEVWALALNNLSERSTRVRMVQSDTEHGPLFSARSGDARDSARVLLPELQRALIERVGVPCVGIPHRDTFFACDARVPWLVRELRARVAHDAARAPHRLSEQLFTFGGGGLQALY